MYSIYYDISYDIFLQHHNFKKIFVKTIDNIFINVI